MSKKEKQLEALVKQQAEQLAILSSNYKSWEEDFGFLNLIMTRTTNAHKLFYLETYSAQLENNMVLKDDDILDSVVDLVTNIIESLSDNYIKFLTNKYFKNEKELYSYISDSVYIDVLKNANKTNLNKIAKIHHKKLSEEIWSLNTKKSE